MKNEYNEDIVAITQPINGYPNYMVDELGNVYNAYSGKKLKAKSLNGNMVVGLYNGKRKQQNVSVRRIVWDAFSNSDQYVRYIGYKDGNPTNCAFDNLFDDYERVSLNYAKVNKISNRVRVKNDKGVTFESISDAARTFKTTPGAISNAITNKTKVKGMRWEKI